MKFYLILILFHISIIRKRNNNFMSCSSFRVKLSLLWGTSHQIIIINVYETIRFILNSGRYFREYYRSGSRVISRPEKSRKFFNAFFNFKCLLFFTKERIFYYKTSLMELINLKMLKIVVNKYQSNNISKYSYIMIN